MKALQEKLRELSERKYRLLIKLATANNGEITLPLNLSMDKREGVTEIEN